MYPTRRTHAHASSPSTIPSTHHRKRTPPSNKHLSRKHSQSIKLSSFHKYRTLCCAVSLLLNLLLLYIGTTSYLLAPSNPAAIISDRDIHPHHAYGQHPHPHQHSHTHVVDSPDSPPAPHAQSAFHMHITTASLPFVANPMSHIADSHQRELSWISPASRRLSGDIDRRAHPNLYITQSEHDLWFNNRLFVFERQKAAFCVIEKNSCSMFKQIFKRIRGKPDYLSSDYTKIHYLPYRGLEEISFFETDKLAEFHNDDEFYFAVFVREPLERLVSGYLDKCVKKRGVNLCDYARWSPRFEETYGAWTSRMGKQFTPEFGIWADGLLHCPCWPETDWHFAPQFNFCNLYQYADKYDIFRMENRTHRKIWMQRAGLWEEFGKSGWSADMDMFDGPRGGARHGGGGDGGDGGDDGDDGGDGSIVDFGPKRHSSTGDSKEGAKYIDKYKQVSAHVFAAILDGYRNDYVIFGIQLPQWLCDDALSVLMNDADVKRALRTMPRTSRPPCDNYRWLWERE